MTERQFAFLVKYASQLGIKTFKELADYKRAKGARTNGDVIAAMYKDLQAQKAAS